MRVERLSGLRPSVVPLLEAHATSRRGCASLWVSSAIGATPGSQIAGVVVAAASAARRLCCEPVASGVYKARPRRIGHTEPAPLQAIHLGRFSSHDVVNGTPRLAEYHDALEILRTLRVTQGGRRTRW